MVCIFSRDHTSISKCSLFRNCWFQPLVSAPAQLPCGRPLPIRHPAHGSVLVHRGPAPLSDSPAAHHPLPLLGHPAFQQGLLPVLPGHQLPLPQRSDHGQCHRGMEPAPENCPQGPDVHWGPAGQVRPGNGSSPQAGRQRGPHLLEPKLILPSLVILGNKLIAHHPLTYSFLKYLVSRYTARLLGGSQKCLRITWEAN
uniref:Uncharacterized protein n=1 Tax=Sus scrofa TaxID=9823 RepID=A0A8D0QXU1_PIG